MPRHDSESVREAILYFIVTFTAEHSRSPSHREIGIATGRSKQSASKHLKDLEALGHLSIEGPCDIVVHIRPKQPVTATTRPDPHAEIVLEAQRRMRLLLPGIADDVCATLAEAVAGAVERSQPQS